jgi:hypothetical protein
VALGFSCEACRLFLAADHYDNRVANPAGAATILLGISTHWFLYPASLSPWNSSVASGPGLSSKICVSIPLIISIPISGRSPGSLVAIPLSGQLIQLQPADFSASAISVAKSIDSGPTAAIAKAMFENALIRSVRLALQR